MADSTALIEVIFPDTKLFHSNVVKGVLNTKVTMEEVFEFCQKKGYYGLPTSGDQSKSRWLPASKCPNLNPNASSKPEQPLADFFNSVLTCVQTAAGPFKCQRKWQVAATTPVRGAEVNRKPDLFLPMVDIPGSDMDWRDAACVGEVKSHQNMNTEKSTYVEMAGKVALILYAQDTRHSVVCIRVLGQWIYLTFFDRGGSLSISPVDIHSNPEEFLRILIGVTASPFIDLGFDETITRDQEVQEGETGRRM
ncbi:hypothetical protein PAXINDRAFT_157676 [Paxillus involutus ATCC 200175]|uniref:Fungal-type protein kinase domain-containing protein n=1 Tax=Paxillus involutus ATCC 200175 TaxID=664439 RepID=A0A0C9THK0_PAXIN|nr:hypothetical protein PAXINDRAFT_157676 [Paxillus involutus ATCC 200175]